MYNKEWVPRYLMQGTRTGELNGIIQVSWEGKEGKRNKNGGLNSAVQTKSVANRYHSAPQPVYIISMDVRGYEKLNQRMGE